jgi:hypothetical protein
MKTPIVDFLRKKSEIVANFQKLFDRDLYELKQHTLNPIFYAQRKLKFKTQILEKFLIFI